MITNDIAPNSIWMIPLTFMAKDEDFDHYIFIGIVIDPVGPMLTGSPNQDIASSSSSGLQHTAFDSWLQACLMRYESCRGDMGSAKSRHHSTNSCKVKHLPNLVSLDR